MPTTFLVVLVIWLCMLFGGFGLFATPQRNGPLGPRALCGCGFQLDLSDTGDEPAIHRADQDLQQTAALRPLPARAQVAVEMNLSTSATKQRMVRCIFSNEWTKLNKF